MSQQITFIGGGNMANALVGGLVSQGIAAKNITVTDLNISNLDSLEKNYGINTSQDNQAAAASADIIVLAVKPQVMETVLKPLQAVLLKKRPLIISIAAGINLNSLAIWSGSSDLPIVRCMPNTPSLMGLGASGLFANAAVSETQKQSAQDILKAVGIALWVNSEAEIDAVTAVSGSGPAYYFLLMEAMVAAGQKLGLSESVARQLTLQTALGAATMANKSADSPAELRRKVTSPNGTTEQAIKTFEAGDFSGLVSDALRAANDRSLSLSQELGAK